MIIEIITEGINHTKNIQLCQENFQKKLIEILKESGHRIIEINKILTEASIESIRVRDKLVSEIINTESTAKGNNKKSLFLACMGN